MAKGIIIESGTPRTLALEGVEVAHGGSANQAGLYAVGNKLYLDGAEIADAEGTTGLLISDGEVTYNGEAIGAETPPTPPTPSSGLWIPPMQEASSLKKYTYAQLIDKYDTLMNNSGYPGTITKTVYSEKGEGDYDLIHYTFTPNNYTKTYIVEAGIHANEKDAPQTLLRIMDIICNHCNESAYARLAQLRDNVRFVVIPCISAHSYDLLNGAGFGAVNYTDRNGASNALNPNRNADFNHTYATNPNGGNYPWQVAETRHIKDIVESIGPRNIDYLFDYHDGQNPPKHFWFNYNMDGVNGEMCRKCLADLIAYEEELRIAGGEDYRRPNGTDENGVHYNPDEYGYIHPNVADQGGYSTGTVNAWAGITYGIPASGPEYIGGIFGYSFNSEQMTRSLRIRANLLIYAYEMVPKGWTIGEPADAKYFHYDYGKAMTRQGLRRDGSANTESHTIVTFADVYERWDALQSANQSYVTKSAKLGENSSGGSVYSYTLGSGSKKVLFIGGNMRWLAAHKETEFGMYMLAEYLCDEYIVNQSAFLQRLKNDYTIVVLPCIDVNAGGNADGISTNGLNAAGLANAAKWNEVSGKCVPTNYALNTAADVPIFMSWIAANQDAIILVSGGEDTSGYNTERPKYTTDYMTQFIVPRTQTIPSWLTAYCTHLEDDRGEDEPNIERTKSVSYQSNLLGLTCGDYAYDTYGIETYFINLKVSNKWAERRQYAQSNDGPDYYLYRNYETGRRVANIVNFFLMAGGDIAPEGGLVEEGGES